MHLYGFGGLEIDGDVHFALTPETPGERKLSFIPQHKRFIRENWDYM